MADTQQIYLVNNFLINLVGSIVASKVNLNTDDIKIILLTSGTNISVSTAKYSDITGEVANGNGYTTGGISVGNQTVTQSGSSVIFDGDPVEWTASGGGITARKYAFIDNTNSDKTVIGFANINTGGTDVSITDTNKLTINPHATNGWLRFTVSNPS